MCAVDESDWLWSLGPRHVSWLWMGSRRMMLIMLGTVLHTWLLNFRTISWLLRSYWKQTPSKDALGIQMWKEVLVWLVQTELQSLPYCITLYSEEQRKAGSSPMKSRKRLAHDVFDIFATHASLAMLSPIVKDSKPLSGSPHIFFFFFFFGLSNICL